MNRLSIAPGGGFGYQVRHLDFHPSGTWVFVVLERQNQIHVYRRMPDGTLSPSPLFVRSTLTRTTKPLPGQTASSVHFHPNGRFVYVANRAADTVDFRGRQVFASGENSIAVFSVNPETGEPALMQSIDTHGFTPRTFSLDPSGGILAVANQSPLATRDGTAAKTVPASIALFRVGAGGKLEFARKYDVETSPDRQLFWTGIVSLP
jgi:6-phosphogluconolactonase